MKEISFMIYQKPAGGYSAKAIGFYIFTEADTVTELREMLRDCVNCHFHAVEIPTLIRMQFIHEEFLMTNKFLNDEKQRE